MKKTTLILLTAAMTLAMSATAFGAGWIQDTSRPENENGVSNLWYQYDDGTYPAND